MISHEKITERQARNRILCGIARYFTCTDEDVYSYDVNVDGSVNGYRYEKLIYMHSPADIYSTHACWSLTNSLKVKP